jgi:surfactin synthase thioesterase subunit
MSKAVGDIAFFPGAGSFGAEFQVLGAAFDPAATWLARYPGRFGRGFGVPAESFDQVVQACAEQTISRTSAHPILFGHSFGAYAAYATALRLERETTADIEPSALVVVGAAAPEHLKVAQLTTAEQAERYLERVDPGALAAAPSAEWRDIVVDATLSDLRLLSEFAAFTSPRVRCPIIAIRGDADPLTSDATLAEWANSTDGGFSLRLFPGGHSEFLRSADCVPRIRELLESLS